MRKIDEDTDKHFHFIEWHPGPESRRKAADQ
jgi:hypothetical protein